MVEVGRESDAAADDVFGRKVDVDSVCAACSLGVIVFDAADESLIVLQRHVGVEVEVVADALLRTFDFQQLNVAEIGISCLMALRQSLIRLFLKNWSCLAVSEFWS